MDQNKILIALFSNLSALFGEVAKQLAKVPNTKLESVEVVEAEDTESGDVTTEVDEEEASAPKKVSKKGKKKSKKKKDPLKDKTDFRPEGDGDHPEERPQPSKLTSKTIASRIQKMMKAGFVQLIEIREALDGVGVANIAELEGEDLDVFWEGFKADYKALRKKQREMA